MHERPCPSSPSSQGVLHVSPRYMHPMNSDTIIDPNTYIFHMQIFTKAVDFRTDLLTSFFVVGIKAVSDFF